MGLTVGLGLTSGDGVTSVLKDDDELSVLSALLWLSVDFGSVVPVEFVPSADDVADSDFESDESVDPADIWDAERAESESEPAACAASLDCAEVGSEAPTVPDPASDLASDVLAAPTTTGLVVAPVPVETFDSESGAASALTGADEMMTTAVSDAARACLMCNFFPPSLPIKLFYYRTLKAFCN